MQALKRAGTAKALCKHLSSFERVQLTGHASKCSYKLLPPDHHVQIETN